LALLLWAPARTVAGDYLVDAWTSENGLPDSSVTAVAQTPDGYLWVGTYNGLARFDGVRFVTFDPANTPALTHARIRRLSVDGSGILWISTYDGSLTRYQNGQFALERRNNRPADGEVTFVTSSSNQLVFLTSRGELLRKPATLPPGDGWEEIPPPGRGIGALSCADGNGTIWYRDGDKHLWRLAGNRFEAVPGEAGLTGQNVNCLTTDAHGRLWVGTDRGFAFWNGAQFQTAVPSNTVDALDVECLAVAADDRIWAVANGAVCTAFAGHWLAGPETERKFFGSNPGRISAVEDHHGGMWFYNYGRGLLHVGAEGQLQPLTSTNGFPGERVYGFFEDREGDWWAGLDSAGLVRLRARQFHVIAAGDNSPAKAAKSICEDLQGTIWIGMVSGGLANWREDGSINPAAFDGNSAISVFCICPDAKGRLWASAGDEDLFVRDGEKFKRITPLVHGVKAILASRTGRIWAGTPTGLFFSDDGTPDGFQPFKGNTLRNVRALAEDQAGNIWGGTGSGDLFCITNNKATTFHPTGKQESGAIWSVLTDDEGTVWAGTFRGGLLRFRDGKFTRYGKKDGLPDNVICEVLDDGNKNLWLGSHQGVFRVAKSALDDFARGKSRFVPCVTYGRSDGMPSQECSGGYQPAGWRDLKGRLWFATAKGATWVQPKEVHPNLTPPLVAIEEVLVDGRTQNLPEVAAGTKLVIPPGKQQIEFRYTGLSLASPERVQFRYQLDGLNSGWVQAGTRRFAQYNFLPPGDYRFHVLACNSDGVWNETGSMLAVDIQPHFYETWWLRTLAVVLVLGTVAGIVRHTATRRLHLQMEQLERRQAIERERSRIAKDIHDDLGASLTLIAVLGDLAKKEKTGERIEKMSGTAREAVKSLDEIVWAVNPRNDTLSHLVDYTGQFATDYLRDAGIRCLLDVPEQMPAREVPANVRHNVFLVVKEALQNIVKHAHATEVWLHVNASGNGLRIAVEDNGCGFDKAPEDAWADGLRNMRQRLAEVGGECRIQSDVGKGTTISVELPLPNR
jgi:signal transduction histidine kinase/ligand-binding sensor domain-containing protein